MGSSSNQSNQSKSIINIQHCYVFKDLSKLFFVLAVRSGEHIGKIIFQ